MTQMFNDDGHLVPLTIIQAGPCKVLKLKEAEKDGYSAAVVGFEETEGSKLRSKAKLGFFKKLGTPVYRVVREFKNFEAEAGQELTVKDFQKGDSLQIQGTSKGKGFAGAIKRWNFARGRETHGGKFNRALGGTGQATEPARVFKGRKMAGQLGGETVSVKSIEVVDTIPEESLLIVKGPVPGAKNGLLRIMKSNFKSSEKKSA